FHPRLRQQIREPHGAIAVLLGDAAALGDFPDIVGRKAQLALHLAGDDELRRSGRRFRAHGGPRGRERQAAQDGSEKAANWRTVWKPRRARIRWPSGERMKSANCAAAGGEPRSTTSP